MVDSSYATSPQESAAQRGRTGPGPGHDRHKAAVNAPNIRLFRFWCQGASGRPVWPKWRGSRPSGQTYGSKDMIPPRRITRVRTPEDQSARPGSGRNTMGGTLGPAHRKVPRLCRVIGWFEPGLPGGSPVRDFRRPLSRGACTPSRGRTPVYVTRLATVASHHAQRREALPTFIGPPIPVGRQSPARPSRTAPSRAVSRSTRSRS